MTRTVPLWVFVLVLFARVVSADPTSPQKARTAVENWLASDPKPLGADIGDRVRSVETHTDPTGAALYHVIYLDPAGVVIVAADDLVTPIVGFSTGTTFDPSPSNPFGALVTGDVPARVRAARATIAQQPRNSSSSPPRSGFERARARWAELTQSDGPVLESNSLPTVSDIRSGPLTFARWDQTTLCGLSTYNYYTPPNAEGSVDNYPSGCVATAMAILMRCYKYPTAGVGAGRCFTVYTCGSPQIRCLRGGDGNGGPYDWTNAPNVPDCSTTEVQRRAIGAIVHDAGVSVNMDYCPTGSGADTLLAADRFKDTFFYGNAVKGYNNSANIAEADLIQMINPNLDAGYPVLLGIDGAPGGHAVNCDGYGYDSGTLYHHLNMGWSASQDLWYDLPDIDSTPGPFNVIHKCVYNVFTSGTGEIISGRVTDASGVPIDAATVTAERVGGGTYTATTNAKGIYALRKLPSASSYTITVTKTGLLFEQQTVSTGTSSDYAPTSGNRWQVDFVRNEGQPVAQNVSIASCPDVPVSIALAATDDGLPNPPGALTYIITSLPEHGSLSDPAAGQITEVPYSLANLGSHLVYSPSPGYTGLDGFQYKAFDRGAPPYGGNSVVATVSVRVASPCGMPMAPVSPVPADGAIDTALDVTLSWTGKGAFGVLDNGATSNEDYAVTHIRTLPGLSAQKLSWASVTGATGPGLRASYDVIHFTVGSLSTDYAKLRTAVAQGGPLEEFASLGGTLLLNVAGNFGNQSDIGPAGLDYDHSVMHDAESFAAPANPYITGVGFGGTPLNVSMFSNWSRTDHGWLKGLPADTTTTLANADGASLIEYPWGAGRVIATSVTLGWQNAGPEHSGPPWDNELRYAAMPNAACPVTWNVYLGTSPDDLSLVGANLSTPTLHVGQLPYGTTFYWKAAASSPSASTESDVWSFTTGYVYGDTIAQAKQKGDGEVTGCVPSVVTAALPNAFYVESPDRTCGIRVERPGHGLVDGDRVSIGGALATSSDGERYIQAAKVLQAAQGDVTPLGVSSRWIGGGNWNYDAVSGAGQQGVLYGCGPNSIGLLVTTWGKVMSADQGSGSYVIWDGSGTWLGDRQTGHAESIQVTVQLPAGSSLPAVGSFVVVTGVVSCKRTAEGLRPVVVVDHQDQ